MSTRFARVVRNAGWTDTFDELLSLKLLQREHTAVVRRVKVQQTYGPNFRGGMVPCDEGEWINVKDLLAWLHERGR